jgi:serine/threonine protein phosphatase PrpC
LSTSLPILRYWGLSDIGLNRASNQDAWMACPDIGFFALADGIGGRNGGDIAAKEAIQSMYQSINRLSDITNRFQNDANLGRDLRLAIEDANQQVYKMGCKNILLQGMGTTLCCLLWTCGKVYYAHVGDSRIYRFRNAQLDLLTRDHSLLARWLLKRHPPLPVPPKNVITRAIGTPRPANPEINVSLGLPGDLYLLCSDGLSDVLTHEELQKILRNGQSLKRNAQRMIDCAKKMGSNDNITVLMISLTE